METVEKIDTNALPIKVQYIAKTRRDDWDCYEWRVTFSNKDGEWNLPYYCGLAHATRSKINPHSIVPKKPSNDDILHSLILDAEAADMNFSEWCADFGYSDDSIKALTTYKACVEIGTNLGKYLGRDTVKALAVQLQDH